MEAFPHSGQQLASVHPCKHASVMKKFIDRMESSQTDSASPIATSDKSATAGGKKRWGLGGMVRKVTGGSAPPVASEKDRKEASETEAEGVQVDFYLVIVSVIISARNARLTGSVPQVYR